MCVCIYIYICIYICIRRTDIGRYDPWVPSLLHRTQPSSPAFQAEDIERG